MQAGPLAELVDRFSNYLPMLAAGVLVAALGLAVGWVAKRMVIRLLILMRLDRLAGRAGWRAAFGKGDVRAAIYNLLGTLAMLLVFLIFLDNAVQILGLTVLSRMIETLVVYLPNLALAALIIAVGWTLSSVAAQRVEETLEQEDGPRPRLTGKLCKAALIAVVGALALWQLGFAKEIILLAFAITFSAFGVAFALAVGLGSIKPIQRLWEDLFKDRKSDDER